MEKIASKKWKVYLFETCLMVIHTAILYIDISRCSQSTRTRHFRYGLCSKYTCVKEYLLFEACLLQNSELKRKMVHSDKQMSMMKIIESNYTLSTSAKGPLKVNVRCGL